MRRAFNCFQKEYYHPQLIETVKKSNLSGAISVNLIIPIIMAYLFYAIFTHLQIYLWLTIHLTIFIARAIHTQRYNFNINIQFFLLSTTSLLYAILAWQTALYSDELHLFLVGMVISSIVAGAVATIVSLYCIFFSFVTIQLLGTISAFLYLNEELFYLSAIMATAFLLLVLSNGHKQYMQTKETLNLHQQIDDLLNNTSDGFLSFNQYFKCHATFSHKCVDIFKSQNIEHQDIRELLFFNDNEKKELFTEGIQRTNESDDCDTQELFLSLLPKIQTLHSKEIAIEYKFMEKDKFMIILKDITDKTELQSKIEYQEQVQNLLIKVASNRNDFLDLKDSFELFMTNLYTQSSLSDKIIVHLRRNFHTFKGNFSQKGLIHLPKKIHALELEIRNVTSQQKILALCIDANLLESFHKDLEIINSALGNEFLNESKSLTIHLSKIEEIEEKLKSFVCKFDLEQQIALNTIVNDIHELKNISLNELLKPYNEYILNLAIRLEKELNPLTIEGDKEIRISPKFSPFFKSLVHIFNNSVDHGIENCEEREAKNKKSYGTIKCHYEIVSDILILQISDDGAGIDSKLIVQKAIDLGIITSEKAENLSENEALSLIFEDRLSAKDSVSMTSGVGIGMTIIKNELEKLNAHFKIESKKDEGTTFTFYLHIHDNKNENLFYKEDRSSKCENIATTILTQYKNFLLESIQTKLIKITQSPTLPLHQYYSKINLSGGFNGSIIMLSDDLITQSFCNYLIPEGIDASEKDAMYEAVLNEILNTIVGLSLQYFDKDLEDVKIFPPMKLLEENFTDILNQTKTKVSYEIETSNGKVIFFVIA